MAKFVLGAAILFMLATAYFSYQTKGNVTNLRGDKDALTSNLKSTQASLDKSKAETKTAQDQTAAEKQRADGLTNELASAKSAADAATAQVTDLQEKLKAALVVSGTNGGVNPIPGPNGNDELVTKLQGELKDAQAKLAEAQQLNSTLEGKARSAESKASNLEQQEQHRQARLRAPGLTGQVLAVNPGWNFVVLSLGDKQGAVMNAEMLVVRGNDRIAKIRITSVEPSSSVADIVPGSSARGARVQPGDTVIYAGPGQ